VRSAWLGREIKRDLEARHEIVHPDEPQLRDVHARAGRAADRARVVERVDGGLITEVEGSACRTGSAAFLLDPEDPLGTGFLLR
jgi:proline racemase